MWAVNFDAKTIIGSVTYTVTVHSAAATAVILDCATVMLSSGNVAVDAITVNGAAGGAHVGTARGALGTSLVVPIPEASRSVGATFVVHIPYTITETCSALQFLTPEQVCVC